MRTDENLNKKNKDRSLELTLTINCRLNRIIHKIKVENEGENKLE